MPRSIFFFKTKVKNSISLDNPDSIIKQILREINESKKSENTYILKELIYEKRSAFLREINTASSENKRQDLIYAYLNFAKTLESCIFDNKNGLKHISKYYTSSNYRFIYLDNPAKDQAYKIVNNLAVAGTIASLGILTVSAIALGLGFPVLGMIGLSLAFTILMPSLFYLAIETLPKQIKTLKAEAEVFKAALNVNSSDVELNAINKERCNDEDMANTPVISIA
ncbi:hypothetical protein ACNVED_04540 [Legionella sp. D16C41]|uniref:hypothetical protein n=1 Tax=Legionella sp. D16C41 TaxID=3402688 RepID=UPI003AF440FF